MARKDADATQMLPAAQDADPKAAKKAKKSKGDGTEHHDDPHGTDHGRGHDAHGHGDDDGDHADAGGKKAKKGKADGDAGGKAAKAAKGGKPGKGGKPSKQARKAAKAAARGPLAVWRFPVAAGAGLAISVPALLGALQQDTAAFGDGSLDGVLVRGLVFGVVVFWAVGLVDRILQTARHDDAKDTAPTAPLPAARPHDHAA